MVECLPSKQVVAGSNPVSRSKSGRRPAMLSLPISMPVIRRISPPHMVSKPSPSPSSSLRRIASAVGARRYVIACVCLLIVAGALRFYGLSANSMYRDEAISAVTARGAISEVIAESRQYPHSSPILYPLALWAVQKAASTDFSVRFMSAAASLLTVGALLFWMPRLGVPRRAAFLAGLPAALSVAAIEHAQDGREYSVDALVSVALIAGALQYMRDGKRALLCGALLVGPLLQYGLVLFGVGALGFAAFASGGGAWRMADSGGRRPPLGTAIWGWLKGRRDLLLPIGAFAAGCALSWELTGRYHWVSGGWGSDGYLADFYYRVGQGSSQLDFAVRRTWDLLGYHMPSEIAAAALIAFAAALLIGLLRRGRFDVNMVLTLACFSVAAAIWGGLMNVYPFGGSRHSQYLGPIVFLAAGVAFHSLGCELAALSRRAWVGTAIAAAAVGGIALVGADAIRYDNVSAYSQKDDSMKRALATVDERKREGDGVYVSRWDAPVVEFYKGDKPANYFYSEIVCWGKSGGEAVAWAECVYDVVDEMLRVFNESERIWLVHNRSSVPEEMAAHSPELTFEEISGEGRTTLHLITGIEELTTEIRSQWFDVYDDVTAEAPSAAADYNLYLTSRTRVYYAKRPCAAADTEARFFLHVYPVDTADLPARARQNGFANLDFDFYESGLIAEDRCFIWRALPDYPIERIHAGQFVPGEPPIWETELAGRR